MFAINILLDHNCAYFRFRRSCATSAGSLDGEGGIECGAFANIDADSMLAEWSRDKLRSESVPIVCQIPKCSNHFILGDKALPLCVELQLGRTAVVHQTNWEGR